MCTVEQVVYVRQQMGSAHSIKLKHSYLTVKASCVSVLFVGMGIFLHVNTRHQKQSYPACNRNRQRLTAIKSCNYTGNECNHVASCCRH